MTVVINFYDKITKWPQNTTAVNTPPAVYL